MRRRIYITESQFNQLMSASSSKEDYVSAAAYVFAYDKDKILRVLTVQRYSNGTRSVPTGYRERWDGDSCATAKRECREETGVDVEGCKPIFGGDQEWKDRSGLPNIGKNWIFMYNKPIEGMGFKGDGENGDIQWTPLEDLPKYPWWYGMDKMIMAFAEKI